MAIVHTYLQLRQLPRGSLAYILVCARRVECENASATKVTCRIFKVTVCWASLEKK